MIPAEGDPPCGVWIIGMVLAVAAARFAWIWLYGERE